MNYTPRYLQHCNNETLRKKALEIHKLLECCTLCPRRCKINRLNNEKGICNVGALPVVCSYLAHHGEEPPISGTQGSGTVFFSYCNLKCAYCQNHHFSQEGEGEEISIEKLTKIMLYLQKCGCHNINLVTPTHVMPQILMALASAVADGLTIPIVYNTSGYELPEVIRLLNGIVDVYLVDMRYAQTEYSKKYSSAGDYPTHNQESLKEMYRQVGDATFNEDNLITHGIIVRHLVLPNNISGTDTIMKFISEHISKNTYISLMSQYHPYYHAHRYPEIARRITKEEYEDAIACLKKYGLENGWIQDSYGLECFAGVNIKKNI